MRLWHKFLQLSGRDKGVLLKATLALIMVRLGLALLPFRTVRRLLISKGHRMHQQPPSFTPERLAWAVNTMSRYIPGTRRCLTKALALQMLLRQRGYSANFRLGALKTEDGLFQAHAWVEHEGKILIGEQNRMHYTPLPPLNGQS